jgi:predicted negative regulator of RcsB-dependent stress response
MGWIEKNLAKVAVVALALLILLALFAWHEWSVVARRRPKRA